MSAQIKRATEICANDRKPDQGSYNPRQRERCSTVLVEEVVAHFDLGAGFEVIWKQHDRYGHLAQVINLRMISRYLMNGCTLTCMLTHIWLVTQLTYLPNDWLPTSARSTRGHCLGKPPPSAAQSVSSWSSFWAPVCSEGWRWHRGKTSSRRYPRLSMWAAFLLCVCKAALSPPAGLTVNQPLPDNRLVIMLRLFSPATMNQTGGEAHGPRHTKTGWSNKNDSFHACEDKEGFSDSCLEIIIIIW